MTQTSKLIYLAGGGGGGQGGGVGPSMIGVDGHRRAGFRGLRVEGL